jgi:hypothetical protein
MGDLKNNISIVLLDFNDQNLLVIITEWIALKLKILTDIKIRFKKNQTFSQSAQ